MLCVCVLCTCAYVCARVHARVFAHGHAHVSAYVWAHAIHCGYQALALVVCISPHLHSDSHPLTPTSPAHTGFRSHSPPRSSLSGNVRIIDALCACTRSMLTHTCTQQHSKWRGNFTSHAGHEHSPQCCVGPRLKTNQDSQLKG